VAQSSLFLFVCMKLRNCLLITVYCLLTAACQPEVVRVEVTREVFWDGGVTVTPEVVTETVEVTRVVTEQVTRMVETTAVVETTTPEEVIIEVTKAPLGTLDRPIQLLFAPTVATAVISSRSQALVDALEAATGQEFEMGILDSEQAVIDLMCTAPGDVIAFVTAVAYTIAHDQCGVQIAAVGRDDMDLTWQMGMIVVRRDSDIESLADLAGKRGAVPDLNSVANAQYVQAMLAEAGVATADLAEIPSDSSAMLAVFNGEVDFATATFLPPILPYDERDWQPGEDDPELWRSLGFAPRRSPLGYIFVNGDPDFGGYRIRDARSRVFDIAPEIFAETQILTVTAAIPNQTVAFGADFPLGTARQVLTTLLDFAQSETCTISICASDFYNWTGLEVAEDAEYEVIRFMLRELEESNQ
jgi:phosphonate transport system substrate-binding protein